MKKFMALLTASAMILAISSCSGEPAATTTTPAETTTTPMETTTTPEETTTTPEETTAPEETDAPAESGDPMEILREKAPLYAYYFEESMSFPSYLSISYEADLYGTGTLSQCSVVTVMESLEKVLVKTVVDDVSSGVILNGNDYYMISPAEKTALYMKIEDAQMEEIRASMTASTGLQFDPAAAEYESGTEEFEGAEYLFNRITAPAIGEILVYADPATSEITHIINAGITMKIDELSHRTVEAAFEIPDDYTVVDMAEAMGAQ